MLPQAETAASSSSHYLFSFILFFSEESTISLPFLIYQSNFKLNKVINLNKTILTRILSLIKHFINHKYDLNQFKIKRASNFRNFKMILIKLNFTTKIQ